MTHHICDSLGLGFRVHVPLTVNIPDGPQVATGAPKYSGWHPVEHCSPGTRPTQLAGQGSEPLTVGIVLALQTAGNGGARYSKARREAGGGQHTKLPTAACSACRSGKAGCTHVRLEWQPAAQLLLGGVCSQAVLTLALVPRHHPTVCHNSPTGAKRQVPFTVKTPLAWQVASGVPGGLPVKLAAQVAVQVCVGDSPMQLLGQPVAFAGTGGRTVHTAVQAGRHKITHVSTRMRTCMAQQERALAAPARTRVQQLQDCGGGGGEGSQDVPAESIATTHRQGVGWACSCR